MELSVCSQTLRPNLLPWSLFWYSLPLISFLNSVALCLLLHQIDWQYFTKTGFPLFQFSWSSPPALFRSRPQGVAVRAQTWNAARTSQKRRHPKYASPGVTGGIHSLCSVPEKPDALRRNTWGIIFSEAGGELAPRLVFSLFLWLQLCRLWSVSVQQKSQLLHPADGVDVVPAWPCKQKILLSTDFPSNPGGEQLTRAGSLTPTDSGDAVAVWSRATSVRTLQPIRQNVAIFRFLLLRCWKYTFTLTINPKGEVEKVMWSQCKEEVQWQMFMQSRRTF